VALSRGSPRVGVTHHLALWSPDVPRHTHAPAEADGTGATRPSGRLVRRRSPYDGSYAAAMTSSDEPPYDPIATTQQSLPAPTRAAGAHSVQTLKRGPGWGTYIVTVLALLIVAAVIVFVIQNDNEGLTVKFLSYKHHYRRSSVALGAAAIAGFLAGIFVGIIPWLSTRRKLRALRRSGQ
jgi:uncharacterized integral membrane protein